MYHDSKWPILEFDDNPVAKLEPSNLAGDGFDSDKMVITFFPEVIDKMLHNGQLQQISTIPGENPLTVYRFTDRPDVLLTIGQVGCACGGNLDLFQAMGIRKVMFCGGGGVLDSTIRVGQVLVVDGAIRDDGLSYHYVPASRVIYSNSDTTNTIISYIEQQNIPYLRGLVWTTDAIFRETEDRIARRKEEGAKIVEMEQAGCLAVAEFRKIAYGALIYGGDDLTGKEWDERGWRSREGVRYDLVQLCAKLVCVI